MDMLKTTNLGTLLVAFACLAVFSSTILFRKIVTNIGFIGSHFLFLAVIWEDLQEFGLCFAEAAVYCAFSHVCISFLFGEYGMLWILINYWDRCLIWSDLIHWILLQHIFFGGNSCWAGLQWGRSPGKKGSHFHPDSDLFNPSEKKDVITSTVCWTAMVTLLVGLSCIMGPVQMLKLYVVPYWVGPILLLLLFGLNSRDFVFKWIASIY